LHFILFLSDNTAQAHEYAAELVKELGNQPAMAPFGAESFVFQFTIQKYKDQDIQNYNFVFFMGMKLGR